MVSPECHLGLAGCAPLTSCVVDYTCLPLPGAWADLCASCLSCSVEDQKELASPVSPELRQKEVQMNFLNQLTSVFNPRVATSSSTAPQTQVLAEGFLYLVKLTGRWMFFEASGQHSGRTDHWWFASCLQSRVQHESDLSVLAGLGLMSSLNG